MGECDAVCSVKCTYFISPSGPPPSTQYWNITKHFHVCVCGNLERYIPLKKIGAGSLCHSFNQWHCRVNSCLCWHIDGTPGWLRILFVMDFFFCPLTPAWSTIWSYRISICVSCIFYSLLCMAISSPNIHAINFTPGTEKQLSQFDTQNRRCTLQARLQQAPQLNVVTASDVTLTTELTPTKCTPLGVPSTVT